VVGPYSLDMGILDFFMGIQDPVAGRYRITKASTPPTNSSVGTCDMVGELTGPGIAPRTIEHTSPFTSIDKWPRPGDELPVLFDLTNPDFLKVEWKQIAARDE
jgi:hypothetical protein